ncbi:unnamed protein product [Rhizophagus irregularis]|nr:unnamed protein product [Rhizophagus irregularis]
MRVQEFGLVGEIDGYKLHFLSDNSENCYNYNLEIANVALVKQLEDKESKINQLPVSRKENEKKELTPMQVDKKEEKIHKKGREEKEWKTPSPNQVTL